VSEFRPPTRPPAAPRPGDRRWQIVNYIGIAEQLLRAAANKRLAALKLPFGEFVMLNHFSHDPARPRSVGETATALQAPQPGVTKMLQRLARKGLVAVVPGAPDGRVKLHVMTAKGQALHRRALECFAPDIARAFADWPEDDIQRLHALLFRLKSWLDADRDKPAAR
jgi:DNA-binding MarR family transcriptional regulator